MFVEERCRKAEFNQSSAGVRVGMTTPLLDTIHGGVGASHGVCQELCGKWARMMIKGEVKTPEERMRRLGTYKTMRKAIVRHTRPVPFLERGRKVMPNTRGDLLTALVRLKYSIANPAASSRQNVMHLYGLTEKVPLKKYAVDEAIEMMRKARHLCSFVTVSVANLGQHTMACRGGKYRIEFFDPNKGEYHLKSDDFEDWFGELLQHYRVNPRLKIEVAIFKDKVVNASARKIQKVTQLQSMVALAILQSKGAQTHQEIGTQQSAGYLDKTRLGEILDFYFGPGWTEFDQQSVNRLLQCLSQRECDDLMEVVQDGP
jgi:virulence surface antigen